LGQINCPVIDLLLPKYAHDEVVKNDLSFVRIKSTTQDYFVINFNDK